VSDPKLVSLLVGDMRSPRAVAALVLAGGQSHAAVVDEAALRTHQMGYVVDVSVFQDLAEVF
jgi:hypothetical protein